MIQLADFNICQWKHIVKLAFYQLGSLCLRKGIFNVLLRPLRCIFASLFEIQQSLWDSTWDRITVCPGTWETCGRPDNMWVCLKIHVLKIPCFPAQFQFFQRDISFLLAKLMKTPCFFKAYSRSRAVQPLLGEDSSFAKQGFILKESTVKAATWLEDPHLITLVQFWSLARDAGILTSGTWYEWCVRCNDRVLDNSDSWEEASNSKPAENNSSLIMGWICLKPISTFWNMTGFWGKSFSNLPKP